MVDLRESSLLSRIPRYLLWCRFCPTLLSGSHSPRLINAYWMLFESIWKQEWASSVFISFDLHSSQFCFPIFAQISSALIDVDEPSSRQTSPLIFNHFVAPSFSSVCEDNNCSGCSKVSLKTVWNFVLATGSEGLLSIFTFSKHSYYCLICAFEFFSKLISRSSEWSHICSIFCDFFSIFLFSAHGLLGRM